MSIPGEWSPGYLMFRQAVRKYRPSDLLPALALAAVRENPNFRGFDDVRDQPPWAIAAAARESLLYGTEQFRSNLPNPAIIAKLVQYFAQTYDEVPAQTPASMLTPMFAEQFPYQETLFEEISRSWALLGDPAYGRVFDWRQILGSPLERAIRASIIVFLVVSRNGGRFDPSLLDSEAAASIFERTSSRSDVENVAKFLTATILEAKAMNNKATKLPNYLARYAFNPLHAKPLIDLGAAGVWAPQSALIIRAMTTGKLYYPAIAKWGSEFSNELGHRTEAYTGAQLRLLAPDVLSEITYGKKKDKSVDWIWVTKDAVILFECKSARLTFGAQAGDRTLADVVDRHLNKARNQIENTADLIRSKHRDFVHIPSDRPLIGITVTAEQFYLGNSGLPEYGHAGATPSLVASLRDIEFMATCNPKATVKLLLEILSDPERRTWQLSRSLAPLKTGKRNPILADAFHRFDIRTDKPRQ